VKFLNEPAPSRTHQLLVGKHYLALSAIEQRLLTTDDVIQSPLFTELNFDVAIVFE